MNRVLVELSYGYGCQEPSSVEELFIIDDCLENRMKLLHKYRLEEHFQGREDDFLIGKINEFTSYGYHVDYRKATSCCIRLLAKEDAILDAQRVYQEKIEKINDLFKKFKGNRVVIRVYVATTLDITTKD